MDIYDQFSRFHRLYLLKSKKDAPDLIVEYLNWFKNQTGHDINTFMADGGREFVNAKVKRALRDRGAELLISNPMSPNQNGVAEKNNQSIQKLARTMLLAANCTYRLWGEACLCATFLLNLTDECPATRKSAFETIYGHPPNLKILHPFGARRYYYDHKHNKALWTNRGTPAILVGYTERIDGYRVWNPREKKLYKTKDVCFIRPTDIRTQWSPTENSDFSIQESTQPITPDDENDNEEQSKEKPPPQPQSPSPVTLRRRETIRPPRRYEADLTQVPIHEPTTFKEAMDSPFAEQWRKSMLEELESMRRHKVWTLVPPPKHKKPITCRWVLRLKTATDGSLARDLSPRDSSRSRESISASYFHRLRDMIRFACCSLFVQREKCSPNNWTS